MPNSAPSDHPIHTAVRNDDIQELCRLLAAGIDPNLQTPNGVTPLMCAASRDHWEAIQCLLAHDADITLRDGGGRTAANFGTIGPDGRNAVVVLFERMQAYPKAKEHWKAGKFNWRPSCDVTGNHSCPPAG